MATSKQIKRIYALGNECGLLDRSLGSDDNLHLWIKQISFKNHISELTEKQAAFVIEKLEEYKAHTQPLGEQEFMTDAQKSHCFRLVRELSEISPSNASERERLRGIIEKSTGKSVQPRGDIFRNLSRDEGKQIIDLIKRIIRSEKKKRGDDNRGACNADKEKTP